MNNLKYEYRFPERCSHPFMLCRNDRKVFLINYYTIQYADHKKAKYHYFQS